MAVQPIDEPKNPWHLLPRVSPYVLPEDKPFVLAFNEKLGRHDHHLLRLDSVLPEPFLGTKDAPVVLLSNNPGFREKGLALRQDPGFLRKMRKNLRHEKSEYPFIYLDPAFEGPAKGWWESKLKNLIADCGRQVVARSVLEVVYFPYASRKYRHQGTQMPSQAYGFYLVREAVARKAVIVLMRGAKRWLSAVPDLREYEHLCRLNNPRTPAISKRNCRDYEKIVAAIKTAEKQRSLRHK